MKYDINTTTKWKSTEKVTHSLSKQKLSAHVSKGLNNILWFFFSVYLKENARYSLNSSFVSLQPLNSHQKLVLLLKQSAPTGIFLRGSINVLKML